jgi:hypothetical protein
VKLADLTPTNVAAIALVAVVAIVYVKRKAIGDALNPASDKNLAYTGVNAVGAAVTGDKDFTLGGAVYEATHDPRVPGDPTAGDKGVAETASDRYWAWVRSFWGIKPAAAPTTGDFTRADRAGGYAVDAPSSSSPTEYDYSNPNSYGIPL